MTLWFIFIVVRLLSHRIWLSLGLSSIGGLMARCIFACNDVSSLSIDTMWRPGTITRPSIRSSPPFSVSSVHIPKITLAAESVHKNVPTRIRLSVKTMRKIEYSQDLSFSRPGVSTFWWTFNKHCTNSVNTASYVNGKLTFSVTAVLVVAFCDCLLKPPTSEESESLDDCIFLLFGFGFLLRQSNIFHLFFFFFIFQQIECQIYIFTLAKLCSGILNSIFRQLQCEFIFRM